MWNSRWMRWSMVLGFALGGFFDGILLHQILQWHHLLSLTPGAGDLRMQVLWDGYFHALMYGIAGLGLWGLWRSRRDEGANGGRRLLGGLLLGFAVWHLTDAVVSHWLLGIHRIKLDSPNPLAWDLLWLAAFGLAPLAFSWRLLRRGGPGSGAGTSGPAAAALSALVVLAGAWSLVPPRDQAFTTIVFAPGVEPAQAMAAILSAEARLVWSGPDMEVVVIETPAGGSWDFYRAGALLVSGQGLPAGCFAWSRA